MKVKKCALILVLFRGSSFCLRSMEIIFFLPNIHMWSYEARKIQSISKLFVKRLIFESYTETIY